MNKPGDTRLKPALTIDATYRWGQVGDVVVEGTGDEEWVEGWRQEVEEARGEWEDTLGKIND